MVLQVLIGCSHQINFAGPQHASSGGATQVNFAVTRQTDDNDFALPVWVNDCTHDVLQRVASGPRTVLTWVVRVGEFHQSSDRGGPGAVLDVSSWGVAVVDIFRHDRGDSFDVCRISAVGTHVGVFAHLGRVQELVGTGTTHSAGGCFNHDERQLEPVVHVDVRLTHFFVRNVQARVVNVERIRVLHDELTPAQQPRAWPGFITVLGLDLVQVSRQILVRRVQVLDQQREDFFVGGSQKVVGLFTVLEAENTFTESFPPTGLFIRLSRQQRREVDFLRPCLVHFIANNSFDLVQHPQPQRQPRVDSWS